MKSAEPFLVQVYRGTQVESEHQVRAAFWHTTKGLIQAAGDPNHLTLPRSAIKMLQALPLVESGAFDHFKLTEPMLALACASHRAEKIHLDLLQQWMELTNLNEKNLACGGAPNGLFNNCSGKHFGFLTTCLFFGEPLQDYVKEYHPEQRRVRQVLSETMGIDLQKLEWGIDGCGIPTYAVPLQNIARGMSVFLDAESSSPRQSATQRIWRDCTLYPELLSGAKEWFTSVMKLVPGEVLFKNGAEGVLCGLIPKEQLSFALKCVDGNSRATQTVAFEILKTYGILKDPQLEQLRAETGLIIQNTLGERVGEMRVFAKNN